MQLIKRNRQTPDLFSGLSQLHRELDRIFDLSGPQWTAPFKTFDFLEGAWSPKMDLSEDKDHVVVKAELPGLKKEDIDLSVQENVLMLKGERKQEFDEKKENYHRIERVYGQFHRAIRLPALVDAEKIKAVYKDGILEVKLPKKEEAKPRQITVDVQ